MKNESKSPKRCTPEQIVKVIETAILLKDTAINTKIEEASKPIYLTRYE